MEQKPRKVLVVDDEIHIVHVVAIKLRNHGFRVLTANNGKEALEMTIREKPDIVVTDLLMPIMTGIELTEEIRKNEQTKDVPVILLVPRSYSVLQEQQERLAIYGFLYKPFSPKELLRMIEDALHA